MDNADVVSVSELSALLLEKGSARWLDLSLDQLAQHSEDRWTRELFSALSEVRHDTTLRDALKDDFFADWVHQTCTVAETWSVIRLLRGWLGLAHPWDIGVDDVARLTVVRAPPNTLDALLAWAREHRVEEALTQPMSSAAPETADDTTEITVVEAAVRDSRRQRPSQADQYLEQSAHAYLRVAAAFAGASKARDKLWLRTCPQGPANILAERLRELINPFPRAELDAIRFLKDYPVELDPNTGRCRGMLRAQTIIEVTLKLDGFEDNALLGDCETCGDSACVHQAALAARLLDASLDSQDRLHPALRQFAREPSWRRLLTKVAAAPETADPPRALRYLIEWQDGQVYVGVLDLSGQPAHWQLTAARKLLKRLRANDDNRTVLNAIARCAKTLGPERVPVDLAALRALQGQHCVASPSSAQRIQLQEQRLKLRFNEREHGVTPRLSLLDKPVDNPGPQDYLLAHDRDRQILYFAPVTPALRGALGPLQTYRGVFPPESFSDLVSWTSTMHGVVDVELPVSMRSQERPTPRKLLLRVEPRSAGGICVWLGMQAFQLTPYWAPGEGDELVHAFEHGQLIRTRRDLSWESALAERIVEQLQLDQRCDRARANNPRDRANRAELAWSFPIVDEELAVQVLSDAARLTEDLLIEWTDHERKIRPLHTLRASDLCVTFEKEGDWLKLQGSAPVGQTQIGLERLLQAAREGSRFIRVEGPSYVEIEADLFARLERAEWTAHLTRGEIRIILGAVNHWLKLFDDQIIPANVETTQWLVDARSHAVGAPALDQSLSAQLRDYQAAGARWLLQCSEWAPGACLADEMGLGKTIQTIAVLAQRMHRGPALIVAPTSLVSNWIAELERFAPTLRAQVYHGRSRQQCELQAGTATVTTYDVVLRDGDLLPATRFATLVLDEAQVIRNPATKRAKALANLSADFRIALTGTPIENRIGDLWSIFSVTAPGLLGPRSRFRTHLAVPIDRYKNTQRASALRSIVDPLLLRRTKREVAPELPERIEVIHEIEQSKPERELYLSALARARRAFAGPPRERKKDILQSALADLTALRQLACHPRLVVPDSRIESSKLNTLLTLLEDLLPQGHNILIFSQFTTHLTLVREALDNQAIPSLYLDGSVPAAARQNLVDSFQRGDAAVFLISLKAGGAGLNLTQADYVIHLDPWWNPAAEDQASDRAHRIGQTRPVTIIKLVARDTVEEYVLSMHEHKRWIAQSLLSPETIADESQLTLLEDLLRSGDQRASD